jgi:hypothetical protein
VRGGRTTITLLFAGRVARSAGWGMGLADFHPQVIAVARPTACLSLKKNYPRPGLTGFALSCDFQVIDRERLPSDLESVRIESRPLKPPPTCLRRSFNRTASGGGRLVPQTTFLAICRLIAQRKVRVSAHAFARCSRRGILTTEVIAGAAQGLPIEDYPDYHVGPAVLVLQFDSSHLPIHAVWGMEKGTTEPAVLVTAYRPGLDEWNPDFRTRKR